MSSDLAEQEGERARRMRACLRALRQFHATGCVRPVADVFAHGLTYLLSIALVFLSPHPLAAVFGVLVASYKAGRLFEVAHDACHGSYTPDPAVNRWIGRLAFLPSLHVFGLWRFAHNHLHHGYSNLRGRDFVWVPLSKEEYDALPRYRRWLHRIYRHHSGLGIGLYYVNVLWFPRLIIPGARQWRIIQGIRTDVALLTAFVTAMLALAVGSVWADGSGAGVLALRVVGALLVPFLYTAWMIGFVVYFNHTHPDIPWYRSVATWNFARAQMEETTCLRFDVFGYVPAIEAIMSHTVHHIDPRVPLYHLRAARDCIAGILGPLLVEYRFTLRDCSAIMRACKLYDYERQCWLSFAGQPSCLRQEAISRAA